jgi:hypothetical protein
MSIQTETSFERVVVAMNVPADVAGAVSLDTSALMAERLAWTAACKTIPDSPKYKTELVYPHVGQITPTLASTADGLVDEHGAWRCPFCAGGEETCGCVYKPQQPSTPAKPAWARTAEEVERDTEKVRQLSAEQIVRRSPVNAGLVTS